MTDSQFQRSTQRMTAASFSRRSALTGFAAFGALALAGCQTGSSDDDATTAATGDFPRTIEHAYGSTTIEEVPQRVATIAWVNQDVVLALGVVPVGMAATDFGGNANQSTDWFDDALAENGGEEPTKWSETDGLDFQAIAAAEPDLIVGVYSGMTEEDYNRLSEIANTLAPPKDTAPYGTPWDETTRIIGEALGRDQQAEDLISSVEDQLSQAADDNPELAGKTFIYGTVDPSAEEQISIYTDVDNRPRFLKSLGMEQAPVIVEAEGADPSAFFIGWSPERADELESDVLVSWATDEDVRQAIESDELLNKIPAVANNHLVLQTDGQETLSVSAASPLSIPWAIENVVPQIAEVLSDSASAGPDSESASPASESASPAA
ncbi:ABC transporter substrate-binding protein [Kocuria sp.]|uniref:ABC transporter substrate-binding protein n=1 Tax=Kocuria sp. TaxID=1871328 RepID=UPI0026DF4960|nr:ABC transporter substrate-binding protein [Kocuria sp.]MDO5618682.1 ABC transporter substrate-binding protein [Kocuria sp.]